MIKLTGQSGNPMLIHPSMIKAVNQRKLGTTEVFVDERNSPIVVVESVEFISKAIEDSRKDEIISIMSFGLSFERAVTDDGVIYSFSDGDSVVAEHANFEKACNMAMEHVNSCRRVTKSSIW